MCCGIDNHDEHPLLSFGTHESHQMMSMSLVDANLKPATKLRAQTLFKHGEDFAYGVLFRTSFRFKEYIVESNSKQLLSRGVPLAHGGRDRESLTGEVVADPPSKPLPLTIGVHLRHAGEGILTHDIDNAGLACVNKLMVAMNLSHPCVVLLASDRNETLNYWQQQTSLPCSIVTSVHDETNPQYNEHGPFTNTVALKDIELASRADFFIGNFYDRNMMRNLVSTFSQLIAERRASSGSKYATTVHALYLPSCVTTINGKFIPSPMFTDPASASTVCEEAELAAQCVKHYPGKY